MTTPATPARVHPPNGVLADTVALVTGGGRGIGRTIALRLAEEGADIVVAARSRDALEDVADEVRARGRRALAVEADVTVPGDVDALRSTIDAQFGRLDVLVANSGIAGPTAALWDIAPDAWQQTFAVNVTGTYLVCRAVLPIMIAAQRGSIVVIGSMTGKRPLLHRTPYAATKMALVGLVRSLALDVGPHGVRVNLVSPGPVEGERLDDVIERQAEARQQSDADVRRDFQAASPLRRLVAADDVADAVAFLASSRAAAITGEDLNVSNGIEMR